MNPTLAKFSNLYNKGKSQVVWTDLVADLETPVSAILKLSENEQCSVLLESIEGGTTRGRYSIIGVRPDIIWRCFGNKAQMARSDGTFIPENFIDEDLNSIASLRSLVNESTIELPPSLPPMASALVGYAGYDMVRLVENIPDENPDKINIPDGMFIRPTVIVIFDSVKDILTIVTTVFVSNNLNAKEAYDKALSRLNRAVKLLEGPLPKDNAEENQKIEIPEPTSNTTQSSYRKMVNRAKEYIASGDVFQVVPSQRFRVPFNLKPISLYRALRRLNPSPFLFHLNLGEFALVGSSPELLVRLRDNKVTIRPIAGTRPRGIDQEEDNALSQEMLEDPKEQAEHLMLLDLGRNDVGRVSKIGSVKITEQMVVEKYSHVMHIVSNVQGEIDPSYDALHALWAGFPAGTVTGAPKVRAMQIIDELENERRSFYGGCIGYFAANGSMDTCIALRTGLIKNNTLIVQAGGGVVADSDPDAEYQESCNKAQALIRAAQEAVRFATSTNRTI